jgi:SAM-dependent methyltransferase|tara:strand:- start:1700 stop:2041 length:342 start_codon:yes stop_codon:yes gene_type:complete
MREIARILRPGGVLLFSAPFFARVHGVPHDYHRFTPRGVVALAQQAGLRVLLVCIFEQGPGVVSGALLGIEAEHYSNEEMLRGFVCYNGTKGFLQVQEAFPLQVHALIQRPVY